MWWRMARRVWRNYEEYLQSLDWLRVRNREFVRTDYHCEGCGLHGTDRQLEVHHLHYETLGREEPGDLKVLCKRCHRAAHGLTPPPLGVPVQRLVG
jgi:5-methylcytosine-specific restriction endonuclease McrA